MWGKMPAIQISAEELIFKIKKFYNGIRKWQQSNFAMSKILEQFPLKVEYSNKYMKMWKANC
jgi:hypothetical protein